MSEIEKKMEELSRESARTTRLKSVLVILLGFAWATMYFVVLITCAAATKWFLANL